MCFGWYDNKRCEGDNPAIVAPSGAKFNIKETKFYVPVITLSKQNDINLLEQLKIGFKRIIKLNKYRSKMFVQRQNNNLSYIIAQLLID